MKKQVSLKMEIYNNIHTMKTIFFLGVLLFSINTNAQTTPYSNPNLYSKLKPYETNNINLSFKVQQAGLNYIQSEVTKLFNYINDSANGFSNDEQKFLVNNLNLAVKEINRVKSGYDLSYQSNVKILIDFLYESLNNGIKQINNK